jgi:hypothetical protein
MKVIVTFPKSQSLGDKKGFFENVELINSDKGIELYGGGAYLVNKEWYENVKKGNVEDVEYTDEEYENNLEINYTNPINWEEYEIVY